MTVSELVKGLQRYPQDASVEVCTDPAVGGVMALQYSDTQNIVFLLTPRDVSDTRESRDAGWDTGDIWPSWYSLDDDDER